MVGSRTSRVFSACFQHNVPWSEVEAGRRRWVGQRLRRNRPRWPQGCCRRITVAGSKVPIPPRNSFNQNLTSADEATMIALLGSPGAKSSECSPVTGPFKNRIVSAINVGPFKVSGLDAAVNSLKLVFEESRAAGPRRDSGRQNCRHALLRTPSRTTAGERPSIYISAKTSCLKSLRCATRDACSWHRSSTTRAGTGEGVQ